MLRVFTPKKYAGFTLLELLVVIAIIGILVIIVAISVTSVRSQGRDASIMSHLGQVKTEAEMIQIEHASYNNLCDDVVGGLNIANLDLAEIQTQVNNQGGSIVCHADGEAYCAQSGLNMGGFYCLDHTGFSGRISVDNCRDVSINCQ